MTEECERGQPRSELDRLLHYLVVAALTIFVTVCLLLAAFIVREIWLQQQIAALSTNLEDNLAGLEETADVIQNELSEIEANTDDATTIENLDRVAELLNDTDQQLASLGEEIDEVTTLLEVDPESPATDPVLPNESPHVQDRADQVFTIFATLTGVAGIAIAVLLGVAIHAERSRRGRQERPV